MHLRHDVLYHMIRYEPGIASDGDPARRRNYIVLCEVNQHDTDRLARETCWPTSSNTSEHSNYEVCSYRSFSNEYLLYGHIIDGHVVEVSVKQNREKVPTNTNVIKIIPKPCGTADATFWLIL